MRKNIHKLSLLGTVLALAVVSGSTVLALPSHANVHAQAMDTTTTTTGDTTSTGSQSNAHRAAAQLRACENRQKAVTNTMARIADRGQKQLTLFTTIATKVETFYTDKGKTLSNYDALVADVGAKQAAAQTTVDTIKAESTTFSCDSADPKSAITTFKDALKSEISALKGYKTSVKNLIVGVKSVQGSTASSTNQSTGGDQ